MDEDDTIFLIDDTPSVRDSRTLLLKGLRMQPFATAESFIEACRPESHGCVLARGAPPM
jgi:FixJ family two-component response regulator